MLRTCLLLLGCCVLPAIALRAQCPDQEEVRRHVNELKNTVPDTSERIRRLLRYETIVGNCPCRNDSSHEYLLRRIGTLYRAQGDYPRAIEYYTKACQVILDNLRSFSINRRQLLTDYYFMTEVYTLLHNLPAKRKVEDRCIEMAAQLHMSADISALRCLYARVEYLFGIGDYARCVTDAQDCERLAGDYLATPGSNAPTAFGLIASSHGWAVESLLHMQKFDQVEQLLTDNAATYKKKGLGNYLPLVYVELAEMELHRHDALKAKNYFDLALQEAKKLPNHFAWKQTLKTVGREFYFDYLNDPARALVYYQAALQAGRDAPTREDSIEDINILGNIANVYVRQNKFREAFDFFQQAFNRVRPGSDEQSMLRSAGDTNYGKIHYIAGLLIDKADACLAQYRLTAQTNTLEQAAHIYRIADQLLERIDAAQTDLQSRLFWRADTRRLYEHAISACFSQHNDSAAFYFFEKSRAVLLNDQLLVQRRQGGEAISRRAVLLRKMAQQQRELEGQGIAATRARELQTARFAARQELDSLDRSIKARDPLYYQGFIDNSVITLSDTRKQLLADHTALLELFYGDSAVYLLLADREGNRLRSIDKKIYDSTVQQYLSFLSDPDSLNRHFPGYIRVAHQLCELLFDGRLPAPGRLIVSPDGRSFPLEALVANADPHAPAYLLNDYALSYTYSARYLQNSFADAGDRAAGSFLGVAPVHYSTRLPLAALQGSDQSLETISGYFYPSLNLLSGEATSDRFRREFGNYSVIQLYTHSCDSSDRNEPVIYFADAPLYLSDLIPDRQPATRLIVLSACETANGRFYRGEGVFSFNRGFAALGIPSAVSNLWAIDNTATYRITELFYKYLARRLPIDLALQQARLEFIRTAGSHEKQLPYYWAASIVIGKTDPIDYPRPFPGPWIAAGLIVIILFVLFLLRRRSRLHAPAS